jgi:hypothetical protein
MSSSPVFRPSHCLVCLHRWFIFLSTATVSADCLSVNVKLLSSELSNDHVFVNVTGVHGTTNNFVQYSTRQCS